ncbi:hypothetical protein [Fluviicola sp.]|uniref:hypothetical protein n=1 Tax=Fluviicola sp. TaxID=1917219 RepID=UPI0031DF02EC
MKKRLFFLICGMLVCSCTITKRHFGTGYHVEWNRKIKTSPDPEEESRGKKSTDISAVQKDTLEPESLLTDIPESHEQLVVTLVPVTEVEQLVEDEEKESSLKSEIKIQTSREINRSKSKVTKETDDETEEEPRSGMHPLMWGIWAMWSIAIACMFFVTFYAEALIGVGLGFFIAMIFAIIVIRALRKHPEKYGFKGLTYGFAIPAIVFGGIALAGLLLFLGGGYGISY